MCNIDFIYMCDTSHVSHDNSESYSCKSRKSKNLSQKRELYAETPPFPRMGYLRILHRTVCKKYPAHICK